MMSELLKKSAKTFVFSVIDIQNVKNMLIMNILYNHWVTRLLTSL